MRGRSKVFDPRNVQTTARRTEQGELWQKLLSWATIAVIVAIIGIAVALFLPVIKQHRSLVAEKEAVQQQIQEENNLSVQLQNEIQLLDKDPVYIERTARDVLNYGRQGETVFRFPAYEE
ncbi:MAG: septum formation initiator family protein [Verrucomicrobiota bacterium]